MNKTYYRGLRNYKYQLMEDYSIQIDIKPAQNIEFKFLSLTITKFSDICFSFLFYSLAISFKFSLLKYGL